MKIQSLPNSRNSTTDSSFIGNMLHCKTSVAQLEAASLPASIKGGLNDLDQISEVSLQLPKA